MKHDYDNKHSLMIGSRYKFVKSQVLDLDSFFDGLEAFLISYDLENNDIELKINYHFPLYWRGTYEMFVSNWQRSL